MKNFVPAPRRVPFPPLVAGRAQPNGFTPLSVDGAFVAWRRYDATTWCVCDCGAGELWAFPLETNVTKTKRQLAELVRLAERGQLTASGEDTFNRLASEHHMYCRFLEAASKVRRVAWRHMFSEGVSRQARTVRRRAPYGATKVQGSCLSADFASESGGGIPRIRRASRKNDRTKRK
jgi:hypothetical protein